MFPEPMRPIRSAPTTGMPAAEFAAIAQNAPAEVNAGVAEAANNAPLFHANDPSNPEAFKSVRAATIEVSLRDSDLAAADMQTIFNALPRGVEPYNNPQAPLQKKEYLAI